VPLTKVKNTTQRGKPQGSEQSTFSHSGPGILVACRSGGSVFSISSDQYWSTDMPKRATGYKHPNDGSVWRAQRVFTLFGGLYALLLVLLTIPFFQSQ
jgi:hypothetical protein